MDAILLISLSSLGLMALVLGVTLALYLKEHRRYRTLSRRAKGLMIEGMAKDGRSAV